MLKRTIWCLLLLGLLSLQSSASQIVLMTGFANSRKPEAAPSVNVDRYFANGIGYAFCARVDIEKSHFWFGPSFFFWNNQTGDPDPNRNSNYYQIELGGRLLYHTQTPAEFYSGVGLGYSIARGEIRERFDYAGLGGEYDFDGEFPTASIIAGIKSPTREYGIGVLVEGGYHFGLDDPSGRMAIGPARAWTVQLGIVLDTRFAGE